MPTSLSAQLLAFARSILTILAEYVPVIDDDHLPRAPNVASAAVVSRRPYDDFMSAAQAEIASRQLFGESDILQMLATAIRVSSRGQQYTGAQFLSGLVQPYCGALQKFIVGCPPGAKEWRDLDSLHRDGLLLYSTSTQATWATLTQIRQVALSWAAKQEALAKKEADAPKEEEETASGTPPSPRPRAKSNDDDDDDDDDLPSNSI
jgi:hypothetical protein